MWFQKVIKLDQKPRGCHLITNELLKSISKDLQPIKIGICNFFLQHSSASITINENFGNFPF